MHHPLQTMSEQSLQVAEQKVVQFLSDELVAVRARDGNIYVSVNHLTKALGLNRRGAVQRIERQPVLFKGFCYGPVETAGGRQQLGLLRVDLVSLWLAGIETSRVKEEIREKLERYQEEAAKVLWEAFQDGRLTTDVSFDDLLQTDSPAAQAYKMALAMLQMARQQLLLEGRIHEHEMRLERIESTLGDPGRYVTPEQASQISQAVKAVALVLSKQTRRNDYGAIYGELYRKFGISGYKLLPARQFDEAITFLTEWHRSLTDDAPF